METERDSDRDRKRERARGMISTLAETCHQKW